MIAQILLIFAMNDLPPKVSQTKFYTLDECADFVDMLAGGSVVSGDYTFMFKSIEPSDGSVYTFKGQCVVEDDSGKIS